MIEIRWHARGGQGAKTAATLLAAAALHEGKHSQGFPEYGPERMGAPIRGFTRIGDQPILLHCNIAEPQIVVVLDPTLIGPVDVIEGLVENGTVIVNTVEPPEKMRARLGLRDGKVCTVDASGIALAELKRDIPNTPMMGALCKVSEVLKLETVKNDIAEKFKAKFRQEIIDGNLRAIDKGYEEVKVG
jgi:pyruvate ferredoxin oxidoreductase gamma subunit